MNAGQARMLSHQPTIALLRRMLTHIDALGQSSQSNSCICTNSWTSCELRSFCYRRTPETLTRYLDTLVATQLTPVSGSGSPYLVEHTASCSLHIRDPKGSSQSPPHYSGDSPLQPLGCSKQEVRRCVHGPASAAHCRVTRSYKSRTSGAVSRMHA